MLPAVAIGTHAVDRRVDVDRAERVVRARPHVVGAEVAALAERPLVADRRLMNGRLRQLRSELDAAGGQRRARSDADVGIRRIDDHLVDLVRAVDATVCS